MTRIVIGVRLAILAVPLFVASLLSACCTPPRELVQYIGSAGSGATANPRIDYHYTAPLYTIRPGDTQDIIDQLSTYAPLIQKADIVILTTGDYTVNDLTLTNGGDVIIVANKVTISAPIDTRVYLNHNHGVIQGTYGPCKSPTEYLTPVQLKAFQDFYAWSNDVWDQASQSYITAKATAYPEMPFSFTSCAQHGFLSGNLIIPEAAEEVDLESLPIAGQVTPGFPSDHLNRGGLKSGDIIIYANDIVVCATCLPPSYNWNGLKPEFSDPAQPVLDRTLLNARGIRGGRGAVTLWGCETNDIDCGPILHPNGPGSPSTPGVGHAPRWGTSSGGLPGYIELGFVNNHARFLQETATGAPTATSLAQRLGSTPGQAGSDQDLNENCKTSYFHPPIPDPAPFPKRHFIFSCATSDGTRNWFLTTPQATSDRTDTNQQIVEITPDHVLYQVGVRLSAMALSRAYRFDDILLPARRGTYIDTLSPADQFEAFLQQAIVDGDNEILAAAAKLGTAEQQIVGRVEPPVLLGLTADPALFGTFSPTQYQLIDGLHRLATISDQGGVPVIDQYFRTAGGLALRGQENPASKIDFNAMLQELTKIQVSIDKLAPLLTGTNMLLFENSTTQQAATLKANVDALQGALNDMQRKANDNHDIFKQIAAIAPQVQKIITDGTAIYTSLYAGAPEAAITPAGDIAGSIDNIRQTLRGAAVDPSDIQRLLGSAQVAYDDFQKQAEALRQDLLSQQYGEVASVLTDRRNLNAQVASNLVLFPDLLRGAIYQYRYNHDATEFQRNLGVISQTYVINGPPATALTLKSMPACRTGAAIVRLEDLMSGAASGVAECVTNDKPPAVAVELRLRTGSVDVTQPLPLAEYSAKSTAASLSLQGLYPVGDLIVVTPPAVGH